MLLVVMFLLGAATRPAGNGGIVIGEAAPDFELAKLVVDEEGKGKVGDEKVRLDSFKGKRPVVLIFSSYT